MTQGNEIKPFVNKATKPDRVLRNDVNDQSLTSNSILAMVKNRLRDNLNQLNHRISGEDVARLARFLLEDLDAAQWRLVPIAPTRDMVSASMAAMRKHRKGAGWVPDKLKHRWRLAAGIEAAPRWDAAKQPSAGTLPE